MRKFRKFMFILTIIFAVLTFAGLVTLLLSSRETVDLLTDAILLLISASSIAIAIFSQISADRDAHRIEKIVHDINDIDEHTEEDLKTDTSFSRKLDEILRLEKEIYEEVSKKHKNTPSVEKTPKNR